MRGGVAFRRNVEFVRQYFRETPSATVREAVRAASQARHGLHWDEVTRIHREMLPELRLLSEGEAGQPPPALPPETVTLMQEPQPQGETVPQHKKPQVSTSRVPLLPVSEEEKRLGSEKRGPGLEVRRRYLNAYLDKYPDATIEQCRDALLATFGVALMSMYIVETVRLAKAARAAPPVPAPVEATMPLSPVRRTDADNDRDLVSMAAAAVTPSPAPPVAPVEPQPAPRATLEEALRAVAAQFKAICEAHQLAEAVLTLRPQQGVSVSFARLERAAWEI